MVEFQGCTKSGRYNGTNKVRQGKYCINNEKLWKLWEQVSLDDQVWRRDEYHDLRVQGYLQKMLIGRWGQIERLFCHIAHTEFKVMGI